MEVFEIYRIVIFENTVRDKEKLSNFECILRDVRVIRNRKLPPIVKLDRWEKCSFRKEALYNSKNKRLKNFL